MPDERRAFRDELAGFLDAVRNTAVLTMPTALNPALLDLDLSEFIESGRGAEGFSFCGQAAPYVPGIQRAVHEFIVERNAMTREVCAEERIPLIDLFALFDTASAADFRCYFHDILHFRPSRYAEVARIVFEAVRNLLR